jgi:hypothetical protein
MHLYEDIFTTSREELIAFGNRLGRVMKDSDRKKPWIINLTGDGISGKELIALAIDQIFTPSRYPNGITREMSADDILEPDFVTQPAVVFTNFNRLICASRENFDDRLQNFADQNPWACVAVASNIERTFQGEFNYQAKGLDSDRLDVSLQVHKRPGNFTRHIGVTYDDNRLLVAIREPLLSPPLHKNCPERNPS